MSQGKYEGKFSVKDGCLIIEIDVLKLAKEAADKTKTPIDNIALGALSKPLEMLHVEKDLDLIKDSKDLSEKSSSEAV